MWLIPLSKADYCMLEPPSTDGGCFGRCTGLLLFKAIATNIFITLSLKDWGNTNHFKFSLRSQLWYRFNAMSHSSTLVSASGNACKYEWQHLLVRVVTLASDSNGIHKTT